MSRLLLSPELAEEWVETAHSKGLDVYWHGWDVVIFSPDPAAYDDPTGAVRNGQPGYETRLRAEGKFGWWIVPDEFDEYSK